MILPTVKTSALQLVRLLRPLASHHWPCTLHTTLIKYSSTTREAGSSVQGQTSQNSTPQPAAPQDTDKQRLLRVALVGFPNAGKSELTNRLVGSKVTGVSPKRNTTIRPHVGAFTEGSRQVVLYDTPGLVQRPEFKHQAQRVLNAWQTAASCDLLLFIVDAHAVFHHRSTAEVHLARQLQAGPPATRAQWHCPPAVLVLNKQDKLPRELRAQVMGLVQGMLCREAAFQCCFWVSALLGEGTRQVRDHLLAQACPGTWLLPAGACHDKGAGELAVELVREKLFQHLHQELPYSLSPQLAGEGMLLRDGRLRLVVEVGVRNEVQRSIIVGRGGALIQQRVVVPSEAELAAALGQPVSLLVRVVVQQRDK